MKLLKQIFYFRGIKIGKKEKIVSRMTVTILLLPFLLLFGLLTYLLFSQLSSNLYFLLVYFLFVVLISFIGTFILYRLLHIKFWFFKKLGNRRLLYRHLLENKIYYPIKRKDKPDKIKLPNVYLKQNKYTIVVTFQLEGRQFQDKFLNIGGALEVMYSADMMGRIDEKGYISYVYSADTILGRISAKDVRVVDKGLILMEDVFWDFVHNPHLLIAGGTGGGKTVLLRSILNGLLREGLVEILDPKQADFVSLAELPVLQDRVVFEVADMINKIIEFKENMEIRYATMRQLQKEKNQKELFIITLFALSYLFYFLREGFILSLIYPFVISYYNVVILQTISKKDFKTITFYMVFIGWIASGAGLFVALENLILFVPIVLLIALIKIMTREYLPKNKEITYV